MKENDKNKLKILMELRPAMEGFAGIPQETRLLFSTFCDIPNIELTGLLNQYTTELLPALKGGKKYNNNKDIHKKLHILSRHIVSHKGIPSRNMVERLFWEFVKRRQRLRLSVRVTIGIPHKLTHFDADDFRDFIWQMLFSKTLPIGDYDKVTGTKFAVLRAPWSDMHRVGMAYPLFPRYLKVATQDYDVLISQTPWPGRPSPKTQLVVRYHDAIPIFLPHTIPDTRFHQYSHYASLLNNQKHALFVCTSNTTRQDLLKIFPRLEDRSTVVHDIVSHDYFKECTRRENLSGIIRNRLEPDTQPSFFTTREKVNFYRSNTDPKNLRYLIMVSTIEPRKNHMKLIGAWETIRARVDPDLKLIIVGRPGWSCEKVLNAMKPWQERGQLFNLSMVPSADMRVLYNGAEAIVCPSIAEGFDLSGIEAMLSGGAVVASDIPVHREVYGDACQYFNPYSTAQCAKAIEAVIEPKNKAHRKELIKRGLKYAEQYKKKNIMQKWEVFFERVRAGEFKKSIARADNQFDDLKAAKLK